jgi:hypothetical protein
MDTSTPFKAMRVATGLSQREVARRAGINSGRMSVIERGLVPSEDERRRLLAVLTAALNKGDVA